MCVKIDNHNRSHLKNDFCLNLCVGSSFQLLGILQYACGLNIGPALTLNQNAIFEMTSVSRLKDQESGTRFQVSKIKKSGMDNLFLKSVYCLSGLGIVRKSRRIPQYFNRIKMFVLYRGNYLWIDFCSFFTIL